MGQEFYTREEAAQILQISPEQLDEMRLNNQIMGYDDAGVLKFAAQDVNALAENRTSVFDTRTTDGGFGSDPNVPASSEFASSQGTSAQGSGEFGASEMGSSEYSSASGSVASDSSGEFSLPPTGTQPPAAPSSDFDLSQEISPTGETSSSSEFDVGSDLDIGSTPAAPSPDFGAPPPPSALKMSEGLPPLPNEDSLEFDLPPAASQVELGGPPAPGPGGTPSTAKTSGQSDVRLDLETGSFEFSMNVDSSNRLGEPIGPVSAGPKTAPKSGPKGGKPDSKPKLEGQTEDDSDVRLDFDAGAAPPEDELISIGDKPDSDVRIDPVSEARSKPGSGFPSGGGHELMETEEIDLGAEIEQAAQQSMAKRPRTTPSPMSKKGPASQAGGGKTLMPEPPKPTMLPTTSPFELSTEDLEGGSALGGSGAGASASGTGESGLGVSGTGESGLGVSGLGTTGGASEFELTLAPEDEAPKTNPLKYGDDEDIDLGGSPTKGDTSSNRAELSGINLQAPADSGVLLSGKKKKTSGGHTPDDAVDFELTLDEDVAGPKTLRGKLTDSDSEFELTLDDSSKSMKKVSKTAGEGDQKDIFETDFDLQGAGGEGDESASQAVALDEPDTDLESSDFDLALEDDQSGSQVAALDDSSSDGPKRKTKVLVGGADSDSDMSVDDSSLSTDADSMLDNELLATEDASAPAPEEEEEAAPMSVPAAQADWGLYPLIMMIPCVLVMLMASLMAYELVHSMWGFHTSTKPTGLLVESFAGLFQSNEPAPAPAGGGAGGAPKAQ
ncbi:hypothetical protein AYO44_04730 [Planctomycetaceae bacterium SCGC AG-212-F19]|nr:hypothetical protein AYO44_04730 [Planctomycetaceae bacterium SCGC AG-212-F19]